MSDRFNDITGTLASAGFRLFPITPRKKAPPLVTDWQHAATSDNDQLLQWLALFPDANAGIYCGGLLVIDIDVKKRVDGFATLAALEAKHSRLPETFTVTTPTGGEHRYFNLPNGVIIGSNAGKLGAGLDIRSTDGYVLAPRSVIQGSGEYKVKGDFPGTTVDDLPLAPDWLVDLLKNEPRSARVSDDRGQPVQTDQDDARRRGAAYLDTLDTVPEGKRDNECIKAAFMLRDLGCTQALIEELLCSKFKAEPPLAPGDYARIARSAFTSGENRAGSKAVASEDFEVAQPVETNSAPSDQAKPESDRPKAPALWLASQCEIPEKYRDDYLVKDWLWRGMDAQLFGPWNAGKTFIALHLAAHLAAGVDWFGQRTTQGGVLYLSFEGNARIRHRVAALKTKHPELPWSTLPFALCPMNEPLVADRATNQNDLPGRKALQSAIKAFAAEFGSPPVLLIVDTYTRAIAGSASDERLAMLFSAMAGALRDRYGMTTLRIHHPGVANQDRARGSYAIGAAVDVEIQAEDGLIKATKQRDVGKGVLGYRLEKIVLGRDQDGDELSSMVAVPGPVRSPLELDSKQKQVMRVIHQTATAHGENRVARQEVRDALKSANLFDKRRFSEQLTALCRKEYITFDRYRITLTERGATGVFDDLGINQSGSIA